jgi:catalase
VDTNLAAAVADGLGLDDVPEPSTPARPPSTELQESPALSILRNGPDSFAGRKVGVLVTDGTDAGVLAELRSALEDEGTTVELVAPKVGGISDSGGTRVPARQKIDGGPSVLYDAVAVLASDTGARVLSRDAPSRDFVSDAHAHCKVIGYVPEALPLLAAAGLDNGAAAPTGDGMVDLRAEGVSAFLSRCRAGRAWSRETLVHQE